MILQKKHVDVSNLNNELQNNNNRIFTV